MSIWGSIKNGLKRAGQVLGGVVGQPVGTAGGRWQITRGRGSPR